ncbi:hypothetical protein P167DRAFT_492273, partial [Morchella conica CCBAS932]
VAMSTTRTPISTPTSFLTPHRVLAMNNMSAILAGVSLLLCLIVLGIVGLIYSNRESRKSLDRLSFRLLMYALLSNCVYSIGYIICVKVNPGVIAGVWLIQFWLGITNYFILCIALNLQLVLVHSVNVLALEKYYIIGTFALNLAITLPPLIKGKFGWDHVIGVCWLTSTNKRDRLIWQISTQLFWILLAVAITGVSAAITLTYLYKHKFPGKGALGSSSAASTSGRFRSIPMLDTRGHPLRRNATRLASKNLSNDKSFRSVVFRISIYPIVMIILNFFITVADLRISTAEGIYTQYDYNLYVVYYAFYGGRGIFYALMAFIDPCISRGLNVWRGQHSPSGLEQEEDALQYSLGGGIISVQAEIIRFVEEIGLFPGSDNGRGQGTRARNGSGSTMDSLRYEESNEGGGERERAMERERGIEVERGRGRERERGPENVGVEERGTWESHGSGQLQLEIQRSVQERMEMMQAAEAHVKRQI